MSVITEERHYRRGLVLGLTISELMLLLLFLLLLLLAHLLRQGEEKLAAVKGEVIVLEDRNQELIEQVGIVKREVTRLNEEKQKIEDDFRDLILQTNTLEKEKQKIEEDLNSALAEKDELAEEIEALKDIVEEGPQKLLKENQELTTQLSDVNQRVDELSKRKEALEEKLAEANHQLATVEDEVRKRLLAGMYERRKDLIEKVQKDLVEKGLSKAKGDFRDGVLRLPQDVLFRSGEGELSFEGKVAVDILADVLSKWIPCYVQALSRHCNESDINQTSANLSAVFIEGHTDDKPVVNRLTVDAYGDNWGLSSARAISAFNSLVKRNSYLGKWKNDDDQKLMSISGYADNRPVAANSTPQGNEKNRRIDVRFIFAPGSGSSGREVTTGVSGAIPNLVPSKDHYSQ